MRRWTSLRSAWEPTWPAWTIWWTEWVNIEQGSAGQVGLNSVFVPGEFDHVDYKGKQTKCRSACEDQVGSAGRTISVLLQEISTSGQLAVRHHLLLPQQKDPHLQRGVLHRHQPPAEEVQELQEETSGQRISRLVQPGRPAGICGVSINYFAINIADPSHYTS